MPRKPWAADPPLCPVEASGGLGGNLRWEEGTFVTVHSTIVGVISRGAA